MDSRTIPAGTRFVWEQAEKRLDAQIRQAEALDTKAGLLLGLQGLAAGLIGTTAGRFHGVSKWVVVASIAGLVISASFAFAAYRIAAYDRRPWPGDLWRLAESNEDAIRYRMLSTRFNALQQNQAELRRRAVHVTISLGTFAVVALMVAVSSVIGIARTP